MRLFQIDVNSIQAGAGRTLTAFLLILLLTACGGGGGGGSEVAPAPAPEPTDPEDEPIALAVIDAIPAATTINASPNQQEIFFTHLGHSDLAITFDADCTIQEARTVRRSVFDLATPDFDQLLDQQLTCAMEENTSYTLNANGTRDNDARFRATHEFSTGTTTDPGITVLNQFAMNPDMVNDLFNGYVEGALVGELNLPGAVEALIVDAIIDISEANWRNLTDPEALYLVETQRVSYLSRAPDGTPARLTGLVTQPVVSFEADFAMRDRLIVLTHATGSTPGDHSLADAWYILANLFASRGYVVVAPDNYGRGDTSGEPETYLMANRTALNGADLVEQVLADENYDAAYDGSDVTIIGYSQGGHSAIGLWQTLTLHHPDISVREVYAGGAPHNLYRTVRGVLEYIDGSCDDDAWCRFVDTETTLPFATDRILPGFLGYTATGLNLDDIVVDDTLAPDFVTGFLSGDATYDALKSMLLGSSFTNIANADDIFGGTDTLVHLYHSEFDRLVPIDNTIELANKLAPVVQVDLHENRCNSNGYELIFNLTETVGVLHTLCGISVLDDAMDDLK